MQIAKSDDGSRIEEQSPDCSDFRMNSDVKFSDRNKKRASSQPQRDRSKSPVFQRNLRARGRLQKLLEGTTVGIMPKE